MNQTCKGCGLHLQNEHPNQPGYTPKTSVDYCQSCYRLLHYGDVSNVNLSQVRPDTVLSKIRDINALFVWVVDLFHLNESMVSGLSRHLKGKDILLAGTKRELLPVTVSNQKIMQQVQNFLKETNVKVLGISFVAHFGQDGQDELIELIETFNRHEKVIFFGNTNTGKSTLINSLAKSEKPISTSYLPGTTIDLIEIETPFGLIYDTPGIQENTPLLSYLSHEALSILQPQKPIKPVNFQLKGNQALWIGGLGYVEFKDATNLSVTCYLPQGVDIHRTKLENAKQQKDRLSTNSFTLNQSPFRAKAIKQIYPKFDLVIHDVGFICISGNVKIIQTHFPKEVILSTRKAYI